MTDWGNSRIHTITPSGSTSTLAGGNTTGLVDGEGSGALFNSPYAITLGNLGDLYVTDQNNHAIRKITSSGITSTLAGNGTPGYAEGSGTSAQFQGPTGIAMDSSGVIYVTDGQGTCIRKIMPDSTTSLLAGTPGYAEGTGTAAQFNNLHHLALDSAGVLYLVDTETIASVS